MLIWKHGEISADNWALVPDDAPVTVAYPLVSLKRWQAEANDNPLVRQAGVLIDADDDVDIPALSPARHPLVAIQFASATDGRGYSQARVLRRRGYAGDLRALGEFGRDQLAFLVRCGFTSFGLASAEAAAGFADSLNAVSLVYQAAADGRETITGLRRVRPSSAQRFKIKGIRPTTA